MARSAVRLGSVWEVVRYRRLQALTIALLAALVTTCAVFAPLYDRATQQALVDVKLAQAPVQLSGLSLSSAEPAGNDFSGVTSQLVPVSDPENLVVLVPASVRRHFAPPVTSTSAQAAVLPDRPSSPSGSLLWRAGFCRHVVLLRGRCPNGAGEIAVSGADAKNFGYQPGTNVTLAGAQIGNNPRIPNVPVKVVGAYRQQASPYWFGLHLTGLSGLSAPGPLAQIQHDYWLTDQATFDSRRISRLPQEYPAADFTLDQQATGVDELLQLPPQLRRLERKAQSLTGQGIPVFTDTGLTEIADLVSHQRDQSRVTIPLLMVQLGLLAVVVLWLVLGAATEQRRPEVALALLRGRGRRGARRLLLRELLPVALAGVPVGVGVALLLCWATVTFFLPGSASIEIRPPPVLALVAAVVVLVALTMLVVRRVAREPVQTLLRSVPTRGSGWRLGALETLVLAAAGTAVVAFVTGGLTGPIALAAPALLALAVGLLLAHVTVPVAAVAGRGLLQRGRVRLGVSVLDAARSPATRRTVAILTVATALLVFSADALVVGSRNRAYAAEQQAGAPLVADVLGNDLGTVRQVLGEVDPKGESVTPVVRISSPDASAPGALAVVPDAFQRIALLPGQTATDIPWHKLAPPDVSPVRVTGTRITGRVATSQLSVGGSGGDVSPTLTLEVVDETNSTLDVPLGTVRTGDHHRRFSGTLHCRTGCLLSALRFDTFPGASISGTLTLSGVRAGGRGVRLGPGSGWNSVNDPETGHTSVTVTVSNDRLDVALSLTENNSVSVHQAWFPSRVPAITTGKLPPGSRGSSFVTTGIDGLDRDATRVATVPRVPASGPDTALVNLDVVQRGSDVDTNSQIMLWFARDDAATLARVTTALQAKGVAVIDSTSLADQRRGYDQSTAAWNLQLAAAVGIAGLLTAILALLVIAVTTWRLRSRDLAALRMSGLGRRSIGWIAVAEHLIAVGLAVVAGAVCGLVGAHFALPTVPLFATAPEVSTLDLSTAWAAVGIASTIAAVVLAAVAWVTGNAIARRSVLQRVRQSL